MSEIRVPITVTFNREKVQNALLKGEAGMIELEKDIWRTLIQMPGAIVHAVIEALEKDKKKETAIVKADDPRS